MNTCLIGICGASGSGKSTLARRLQQEIGCHNTVIISQDSYYLDQSSLDEAKRSAFNFDHPDAIEFDLLRQHLLSLKNRNSVGVPIYDFASHTRKGEIVMTHADHIIVEGHLIFHDSLLRHVFDCKIFLEHDIDILFIRRLLRDIAERGRTMEQVVEQYLETVRPMYFDFVEPYKQYADISFMMDGSIDSHISNLLQYLDKIKLELKVN